MNTKDYEKHLSATRQFLKTSRTAREVAAKFGISLFAAYERLSALKERGQAVRHETPIDGPKGKTGPKARLWQAT